MKTYLAKYENRCNECGDMIEIGEPVSWDCDVEKELHRACLTVPPRLEPRTMPTHTLTDARHAATVRKALDDALVSGQASPKLDFGPIFVRLTTRGYWAVIGPTYVETHFRTTDQAVAAIVALARQS